MMRVEGSQIELGQKIEKKLEVRIDKKYDVVIAGGGVTGFVAAVAAGRLGAQVLLVERKNFIGGNAAMGLQILGSHTITGIRVTAGIPGEFLRRLKATGGASDAVRDARVCSLIAVEPAWVKILALEMLQEAGVDVLLHTAITEALCQNQRVVGVLVNGTRGVLADVVVDTTGDGVVAALAGAPFEVGHENDGWVQPATLIFRMGNVDVERGRRALISMGHQIVHTELIESLGIPMAEFSPWGSKYFSANAFRDEVEQALRAGDLPVDFPQQRVIWSNLMVPGEAMILMAKVIGFDASGREQLSQAEQKAFRLVPTLVRFMRKYIPGFERAHLIDVAPQIGIRETRRIFGEYVLEESDILEGHRFADTIGLGGYYLDVHPPRGGDKKLESMRYPLEPFEIPYRCLLPQKVDQLLIAGRCASATAPAFGAIRVIPCCMVQGQAAGAAAALSAQKGLRLKDLPVETLQEMLRHQEAFLHPEDADTSLVF